MRLKNGSAITDYATDFWQRSLIFLVAVHGILWPPASAWRVIFLGLRDGFVR